MNDVIYRFAENTDDPSQHDGFDDAVSGLAHKFGYKLVSIGSWSSMRVAALNEIANELLLEALKTDD